MKKCGRKMNANIEKRLTESNTWRPYLENLRRIFQDLDLAYEKTAGKYGFQCQGCEDSCCLTRFYHHTFLELLYISKGFNMLASTKKEQVVKRAFRVRQAYAAKDKTGDSIRILCPLIADNQCLLYDYRPMICRAHGIPHTLHHPVKGAITGPGCHIVSQKNDDFRFDRTPFYMSIAQLETQLRESMGIQDKIRLTVADMLILASGKKLS
jgi:Fe-S-cluster containining protein